MQRHVFCVTVCPATLSCGQQFVSCVIFVVQLSFSCNTMIPGFCASARFPNTTTTTCSVTIVPCIPDAGVLSFRCVQHAPSPVLRAWFFLSFYVSVQFRNVFCVIVCRVTISCVQPNHSCAFYAMHLFCPTHVFLSLLACCDRFSA